jgi:hypothetical protein
MKAMNAKSFSTLAGSIFLLGALIHATRLVMEWPLIIGAWNAPIWASWVGVLIAGGLGWLGLRAGTKG